MPELREVCEVREVPSDVIVRRSSPGALLLKRSFGATRTKEQAPKAIAARGDAANEFTSRWLPG